MKRGRGGAVIALSIVAIVLLVVVVRVIIDTLQYSQSASGDPARALPSATTTRSPPQTRLAVTGRGDHTTGRFTVGGAWWLAWRVDCSKATFRLLVIASKPVDGRNKDADLPGVFQQTYMKGRPTGAVTARKSRGAAAPSGS